MVPSPQWKTIRGLAAGAGDREAVRRAGYTALMIGAVFMSVTSIIIALFPYQIEMVLRPARDRNADAITGRSCSPCVAAVPDIRRSAGRGGAVLRGLRATPARSWDRACGSYWLAGFPMCVLEPWLYMKVASASGSASPSRCSVRRHVLAVLVAEPGSLTGCAFGIGLPPAALPGERAQAVGIIGRSQRPHIGIVARNPFRVDGGFLCADFNSYRLPLRACSDRLSRSRGASTGRISATTTPHRPVRRNDARQRRKYSAAQASFGKHFLAKATGRRKVNCSSPAVVNGVVYIGTTDGRLWAYPADGCGARNAIRRCGRHPPSARPAGRVNGVVYVGSQTDDNDASSGLDVRRGWMRASRLCTAVARITGTQSIPGTTNGIGWVCLHRRLRR